MSHKLAPVLENNIHDFNKIFFCHHMLTKIENVKANQLTLTSQRLMVFQNKVMDFSDYTIYSIVLKFDNNNNNKFYTG